MKRHLLNLVFLICTLVALGQNDLFLQNNAVGINSLTGNVTSGNITYGGNALTTNSGDFNLTTATGGVFKFTSDGFRCGSALTQYMKIGHDSTNAFINVVGRGGLQFQYGGITLANLDSTGVFTSTNPIGAWNVTGNTTVTTIATLAVYVDLNLNALASASFTIDGWTLSNTTTGELRYDNFTPITAGIAMVSISFEAGSGGQEHQFRLVKNGVPFGDLITSVETTGTVTREATLLIPFDAVQNDLFRLQTRNNSSTANPIISEVSAIMTSGF